MATPDQILALAYQRASSHLNTSFFTDTELIGQVEYVCRNIQNRAGVRLLLACLLAKLHKPEVDIRKPYTEIGDADTYSGRTYDETYITRFVINHQLPCNQTTAFLTPALRNRNQTLTPEVDLVGRPPKLYKTVLHLLQHVHTEQVDDDDLLAEVVRWLLLVRDERQQRIDSLLAGIASSKDEIPLSSEAIVRIIAQHLRQPRASRLPVLVVAAAYQAASHYLGERVLPLESHTAADSQTHSLGDMEITLIDDDRVVTSYEMKNRPVTHDNVDQALQKILQSQN